MVVQQGSISSDPTEILKDLVVVKFSEEGSRHNLLRLLHGFILLIFLMDVLVRGVIGY